MHLITRNVNTAFRELVDLFRLPRNAEEFFGRVIPISKRSSRNGNVMVIDEPVTITYEKPRERVLFNAARNANPFFHLYHALWMLTGRNDVTSLVYYNKRMTEFSDDGKTLNGAYGYRWRHTKHGVGQRGNAHYGGTINDYRDETDQLDILVNHLKADPTSRRAVLQMWNVEDDLLKIGGPCDACDKVPLNSRNPCNNGLKNQSKDVCCNLSVMFSLRDGPYDAPVGTPDNGCKYLDMTVTNRSNDLIWGMLGEDFVTFSVLQEYVAARLGVEVGRYHHFTNNLHVYDWNWKPEEWLKVYNNEVADDGQRFEDAYPLGSHIPIVKNPETFDDELPRFVERYSGKTPVEELCVGWKEPFLMDVAQPMLIAFARHKGRDYDGAFVGIPEIAADDWRVAATQWISKRKESHERRDKATV